MLIFYLHCNSSLDFTYFRFYKNKLHINTYQCKNSIVPEEGWFGQPKYSTSLKNHPTLCRFLLLYSSLIIIMIIIKIIIIIVRIIIIKTIIIIILITIIIIIIII